MTNDNYHLDNIKKFESNQAKLNFLKDVALGESGVFNKFGNHFNIIKFDEFKCNLKEVFINELIETNLVNATNLAKINFDLGKLHQIIAQNDQIFDPSGRNNFMSQIFQLTKIKNAYADFVKTTIAPLIGEFFYFQDQPTIRVNFPFPANYNKRANYHIDLMLGHLPIIYNFWWSLNNVYGSNSLSVADYDFSINLLKKYDWNFAKLVYDIEFNDDLYNEIRHHSIDLKLNFGDIAVFSPLCLHATQYNTTDTTRVSFDCRFILKSKYEQLNLTYKGLGNKQMPMQPGYYYNLNPIYTP